MPNNVFGTGAGSREEEPRPTARRTGDLRGRGSGRRGRDKHRGLKEGRSRHRNQHMAQAGEEKGWGVAGP